MKKVFLVPLTSFLLLLVGINLFLWFSPGICDRRKHIVRVDTVPGWQKMASPLPADVRNRMIYKFNDPDGALFFHKKDPGDFFFVDRSRHILRVHNSSSEISVTFTDLQNKAYFVD
jgi:hypothetical protein